MEGGGAVVEDGSGDAFLRSIPTFADFAESADERRYRPVPDDWIVGLADVVGSREAIEAGRYKAVNVAGAAVISAVTNALGGSAIPFVFGGDGASFAVPPGRAASASGALAAAATLVAEELGLALRIATVPVAAIREAGHDLRVARFAVSPSLAYAMFSGGGLAWAEAELKAGRIALAPAPPGSRPDLTGLSCRFAAVPAERGLVLSLIVRPGPAGDDPAYRALIRDVLARVADSPAGARPLPETGPAPGSPLAGFGIELGLRRRPGASDALARLRLLLARIGGFLVLRFRVPVGRFRPRRYMADLVANSDYRKYDDGLRMTLDCTPALADELEALLGEAGRKGTAIHGLHRQDAALVTCLTPSVHRRDHIHFVDGAAGGYAAAASAIEGSSRP